MSDRTAAVQTNDLGKQYGAAWALRQCTIEVPAGSITALVGPNGAGKSTLLKLLTGLSQPSEGESLILGQHPTQTASYLADIGYLAQEIPLYATFTAEDYMAMGAHLNPRWDGEFMKQHLKALRIPLNRPVGTLSGGQRAQVALALVLAKKPKLLLLDEPVAALDPLARRDFLSALAQAVADGGLTVIMSSHLLADLELVCDHLIIVRSGEIQLCDDIEHAAATHRLLVGPRSSASPDGCTIIRETHTARQSTLLVHINDRAKFNHAGWHVNEPTIEDIVLAYMGQDTTSPLQKGDA